MPYHLLSIDKPCNSLLKCLRTRQKTKKECGFELEELSMDKKQWITMMIDFVMKLQRNVLSNGEDLFKKKLFYHELHSHQARSAHTIPITIVYNYNITYDNSAH